MLKNKILIAMTFVLTLIFSTTALAFYQPTNHA